MPSSVTDPSGCGAIVKPPMGKSIAPIRQPAEVSVTAAGPGGRLSLCQAPPETCTEGGADAASLIWDTSFIRRTRTTGGPEGAMGRTACVVFLSWLHP